ncbi:hypothetical protein [Thioclava sp. GXIMD4215]|uniref:hypothetical protein n=1 Tax=Thioclava sp. GXIMD4215 TaxID=3131928 RepID=UPI00324E75CB
MLLKLMALFLAGMAVLAMFGKLRLPKGLSGTKRPGQKRLGAKRCPRCGRPQIGSGPCPCGHGKRKG